MNNLLSCIRFLILLMLTGFYGWFCYLAKDFVEIPFTVWTVGLLCAGPQAIELFLQIKKGLAGEK